MKCGENMKYLVLPLVIALGSCKFVVRDGSQLSVNAGGCAYIQQKENDLFAKASRIQDVLFEMLAEFNTSAEKYEQKTGETLSFLNRGSRSFQEFLVQHQEKSSNFRSMQDELHKVFVQLQTVNVINYSHCPRNPRLELDGTNYGLFADKKPASCSTYKDEIIEQKQKVSELNKVFSTAEKDILFSAEETDTLSIEANKLESLSNKLMWVFMGSEAVTMGMIGAYMPVYKYLGSATPLVIGGLEVADFFLSLAWIYSSTKVSNLRIEAQKLRSKYQLMGIDNKMVLKELHKMETNIYFLDDIFRNYCRKV